MYDSTCLGRPHAHHQELNSCSSSLWFYRWSVVVAVLSVVVGPVVGNRRVLGVRTPDTCWAVRKRQVINLRNSWVYLVDLFELYDDAGLTNFKFNERKWNAPDIYRAMFSNVQGVQLKSGPYFNPLKPELNPICYLLALLAHHFLHITRIRVKSLTFRLLMSYIYIYIYIYGAPILDVSRSHTTTQHSR